ncbi:transglutaminase-like putative cysteine protease [Sphingomonas endophytica]|uniref:Transglutaminase-like putative cysteine protease n=1 Tax=Sphingomonas endophytica TaxID=869719 RepID=A0ABR6N8I3_9SPHN|nr:transglutaminase family protein [Sphingomonas endophytica]MBB5727109.1 transglutaminase-like putative cysteine protease [Sphingomonas endophytica]
MRLRIRHCTVYRYNRPVRFLDHRLLVTPRRSCHVTTISSAVTINPAAELIWSEDAAGNTAALALISEEASTLTILAEHEVLHTAENYPIYRLDPAAHSHPFAYAPGDLELLGVGLLASGTEDDAAVTAWLAGFRETAPEDTLMLLNALNEEVGSLITYRTRDEEGTQSPPLTLALRSGSCRDLTALFLCAVRRLGFAARAASGYLFDPGSVVGDVGTTHAWCEVFLPGAGWIAFDPTQRRMGSAGLVATAVGVTSEAVLPVVGGFLGDASDFTDMEASVIVEASA